MVLGFSSPRSGSTSDIYSLKALVGEMTQMFSAFMLPRWRYIRYAARCMATLVLPEPAPPVTDSEPSAQYAVTTSWLAGSVAETSTEPPATDASAPDATQTP